MTSEESMTLYSSPYIRRDVPFEYIGSMYSAWVGSSASSACSGFDGGSSLANWDSSSMEAISIRGRFRWALGPKVSENGSVSTMWDRFGQRVRTRRIQQSRTHLLQS